MNEKLRYLSAVPNDMVWFGRQIWRLLLNNSLVEVNVKIFSRGTSCPSNFMGRSIKLGNLFIKKQMEKTNVNTTSLRLSSYAEYNWETTPILLIFTRPTTFT